jgi:large-conductance mechanosensitive channel
VGVGSCPHLFFYGGIMKEVFEFLVLVFVISFLINGCDTTKTGQDFGSFYKKLKSGFDSEAK